MTVGVGILQGVVLLCLRGSLDCARDDGTRSGIFIRKDDLSRRFFACALNDGGVLLRLRGFLHALCLVEMTTGTNDLSRGFHACALNDMLRYALNDKTALEMTVEGK